MADHPMMTTNIHLYPENKITARPVPGIPGRFSVELGDYGVCIFAGTAELKRIVASIQTAIDIGIPMSELTRVPDPAEAERFRLECERDQKGEDE
jgi:hypothetical protein